MPALISEVFDKVQSSIGEKIANLIFACTTCTASCVYALVYGPTFALVCIAYLPILMTVIAVFGKRV